MIQIGQFSSTMIAAMLFISSASHAEDRGGKPPLSQGDVIRAAKTRMLREHYSKPLLCADQPHLEAFEKELRKQIGMTLMVQDDNQELARQLEHAMFVAKSSEAFSNAVDLAGYGAVFKYVKLIYGAKGGMSMMWGTITVLHSLTAYAKVAAELLEKPEFEEAVHSAATLLYEHIEDPARDWDLAQLRSYGSDISTVNSVYGKLRALRDSSLRQESGDDGAVFGLILDNGADDARDTLAAYLFASLNQLFDQLQLQANQSLMQSLVEYCQAQKGNAPKL